MNPQEVPGCWGPSASEAGMGDWEVPEEMQAAVAQVPSPRLSAHQRPAHLFQLFPVLVLRAGELGGSGLGPTS